MRPALALMLVVSLLCGCQALPIPQHAQQPPPVVQPKKKKVATKPARKKANEYSDLEVAGLVAFVVVGTVMLGTFAAVDR